jgi:MFS family permease
VNRLTSTSFDAALALTAISTFVAMLAYSGPLGNAPTLTAVFAASPGQTTWLLSSMSVGLAVGLLPVAALADLSGRRRVFAIGAGVFAAGSVVCAVAGTPLVFLVGRIVEGVGAAGLIATGLGLVAAVSTDAAQRSRSAAWWGASMGLGIAGGPVLTGLFDLADWWQATYWLLALAGTGVALAARVCFVETTVLPDRRLDLVGAGLLTGGLATLLTALVETRQGSPTVALVCGVVAAGFLVGFVVSQRRGRAPMVPPALVRRPGFLAATVAATAAGAGVIALMSFACTFLATGMGLTSFQAGAMLVLWSGTSAVSAILVRRLAPRLSGTAQLVIGLGVTGVGLLLLAGLHPTSTVVRLVPGLLVAGLATGLLNGGLGRQAVGTAPPELAALGTGVNNTARYVGASIGITAVSLLAATPHADVAARFAGWNLVAVLTGALTLLGAAAVLALTRRGERTRSVSPAPRTGTRASA